MTRQNVVPDGKHESPAEKEQQHTDVIVILSKKTKSNPNLDSSTNIYSRE